MNDAPLFVLLESNPPTMSEFLAVKALLKKNSRLTIAVVEDDSLMLTDRRIEMWLLAFEDNILAKGKIELIVIPQNYLTNPVFLQKLRKGFKHVAVKNKLLYVFFATKGFQMVALPYVPGYEQLFLANAYRQSVAYRYLENYKR